MSTHSVLFLLHSRGAPKTDRHHHSLSSNVLTEMEFHRKVKCSSATHCHHESNPLNNHLYPIHSTQQEIARRIDSCLLNRASNQLPPALRERKGVGCLLPAAPVQIVQSRPDTKPRLSDSSVATQPWDVERLRLRSRPGRVAITGSNTITRNLDLLYTR